MRNTVHPIEGPDHFLENLPHFIEYFTQKKAKVMN